MIDGYATSLIEWTNKPRRRKTTSRRTDKRVISESRPTMTETSSRYTDEMNNSKEAQMSRWQKMIEAAKRKQISPAQEKKEENRKRVKGVKPHVPMNVEQTPEMRIRKKVITEIGKYRKEGGEKGKKQKILE